MRKIAAIAGDDIIRRSGPKGGLTNGFTEIVRDASGYHLPPPSDIHG